MESDLDVTLVFWSASLFQSTLSSWRATCCVPGPIFGPIISIHALLMESDARQVAAGPLLVRFQSTLSSWRATRIPAFLPPLMTYFNPRSPHGERHAMQEGWHRMQIFQSTLSSWRATFVHFPPLSERGNFNPRSPHGERQQIPPNWPYRFCLKCQFKDGEKSKKAKGSASAQASSPAYEKNKVRIPWGDFECFRFAPIK